MYPPPPPPPPSALNGAMHRPATYDPVGMPSPSYNMSAPQPSPRMPRTAPHLRDQPPAPPGVVPPSRPSQTRVWRLQLGQYEFGERTHDLVLLCTNLGGTTPPDELSGTWYITPADLARLLCESEDLNPALVANPRYQSALRMFPISNTPHLDRAIVREIAAPGEHVNPHEEARFAAMRALAQLTATELAMAADANTRGVHHVRDTNVAIAMRVLRDLHIVGAPSPFPVPAMLLIAPQDSSACDTPVPAGPMSPSYAPARLALPPPPPPESPLWSPTALGPSQPSQAIGAVIAQPAVHDSTRVSAPPEPVVPALLYVPPPPSSTQSAPPPPAPASSVPPPPPPPAPAAVVSSTTPEAKSGPETGGKRPRASISQGSSAAPTRGGRAQGGRSRGPSMSEGNPRKRARIEVDENATAMDGVQAVVAATGVSSSTVRRLSVGHAALTVPSEQQREIQRIREEQQSRIAQQNKRAQAAAGAAEGAAAAAATSEPATPAPAEPTPEEEPSDGPMDDSPEAESPPPPPPATKRRGRPKKEKAAAVGETTATPTVAPASAPTLATLLTGPTAEDGDASTGTPAPTQPAPRTLSPVLPPPPVPAPSIIPALLPPPPPLSSIVSSSGGADAAVAPSVIVEPASFGVRYPTAPHLSRPDFLNTAATASDPSLPYGTAPVVIPPLHVADTRQVETAPPPPVRRRISSSRLSSGSSRRHVPPPPPPPPPVPSTRDVTPIGAPTDAQVSAPPAAAAGTGALRTEFLAVMAAVFDSVTTGSQPVTQHLSPALLAALAPVVAAPVPAAPPAPPAPDLAEQLTALVDRIAPLEVRVSAVETAEAERARAAETAEVERVRAAEIAEAERVRAAEMAEASRVRAAEATALVERLAALETRLGAIDGGDADRPAGLVGRVAALETRAPQPVGNTDAECPVAIALLLERVIVLENQVRDADRAADAALVARIGALENRWQAMQEERVAAELAVAERIARIDPLEKRLCAVEGNTASSAALAGLIAPLEGRLSAIEENAVDRAALAGRITLIEDRLGVMQGDLGDHQALVGRIRLLEQQVHDMKEERGDDQVAAAVADHLVPLQERLATLEDSYDDLQRTTKDNKAAVANLKQQQDNVTEHFAALDGRLVALDNHVAAVTDKTAALETRHTALETRIAAREPRVRTLEPAARDGVDGDRAAANGLGAGYRRVVRSTPPTGSQYRGGAAPMNRKDDGGDGSQRRRGGRAE
ncbi:hypothetical protein GGF32_000116 [Allomyces javanicus]|nr:hypothetical protein GGF32_000116 [Allomyces javanicus]